MHLLNKDLVECMSSDIIILKFLFWTLSVHGSRFEGKFEELDSSEVPTDNSHLVPHSTALNCASGIGHHEANLAMLPEVGHCMSDLGPPLSQDSASQCNDPNSPHHDFVGGIMRITPAEVNVSVLSITRL